MTSLIPITYRGRTVAAACRSRYFLAEDLDRRPPDDPERTFVIFMCAFAGDILNARLRGPYTEGRARSFARACLIPAELAERRDLDVPRAALALRVPEAELRGAMARGGS